MSAPRLCVCNQTLPLHLLQLELSQMGRWWSSVDRTSWPEAHVPSIEADCEGEWGDRRQELVFIGANMRQVKKLADARPAADGMFRPVSCVCYM